MNDLERRFWSKVDKSGPCWEWTAAKSSFGHGRFRVNGNLVSPHRMSWEMSNGGIPEGVWVLHKCDNPSCVNPDHLFLGDRADKMKDAANKGRLDHRRYARGAGNASAKMTRGDIVQIRGMYRSGVKQRDIADAFGVHQTTVSKIVNKKRWAHV